ncbi:uncharacterized protein LOC116308711 [Actinia tenebrosa]|uniref:Uncharacterized protein LOC116308711 n=1 Tax=Actinia tenebrosa TaxID=6105 RepID=A0A6P8JBL7_ACTTE|nr:uncharacterized protein LOC116308711 [Actinia tenebrosa]
MTNLIAIKTMDLKTSLALLFVVVFCVLNATTSPVNQEGLRHAKDEKKDVMETKRQECHKLHQPCTLGDYSACSGTCNGKYMMCGGSQNADGSWKFACVLQVFIP